MKQEDGKYSIMFFNPGGFRRLKSILLALHVQEVFVMKKTKKNQFYSSLKQTRISLVLTQKRTNELENLFTHINNCPIFLEQKVKTMSSTELLESRTHFIHDKTDSELIQSTLSQYQTPTYLAEYVHRCIFSLLFWLKYFHNC